MIGSSVLECDVREEEARLFEKAGLLRSSISCRRTSVVYLNRIYTKTGDSGETSLGDGTRVPKTDLRIEAYGTVDELNAVIGVALTELTHEPTAKRLRSVQNDLFDLGADLCVPECEGEQKPASVLRVSEPAVRAVEEWIDLVNADLQPLTSFVLPGGSPAAARLHHARTVCRRAEIAVWKLAGRDSVNSQIAVYLNRLSDLLFVLSRAANDHGNTDVPWVPGGS